MSLTKYKKLEDFDFDWMKSYPREHYEKIIEQLDPEDPTTQVLVAGITVVFKDE